MEQPIKVFISYSHDSDEHKAWVLQLSSDLRLHGINAILDVWDLRIGKDLRLFMEHGLSEAELVVCVCSQSYVEKADQGIRGTGYEMSIMTQDLLSDTNVEFIIPIIRNNQMERKTPIAFGSKLYIDFSDDSQYLANYDKLLQRIYNQDVAKRPALGENPFSNKVSKLIQQQTQIQKILYHKAAMRGHVVFQYDNNNGVYHLGSGEYAFETKWSRSGNNSIHAYGNIGFSSAMIEFPSIEHLIQLDFSSRSRTIKTGQIVVWQNGYSHFVAVRVGEVHSSGHGHAFDELKFDYQILE